MRWLDSREEGRKEAIKGEMLKVGKMHEYLMDSKGGECLEILIDETYVEYLRELYEILKGEILGSLGVEEEEKK